MQASGITEKKFEELVVKLAKKTRATIAKAEISPIDFHTIATLLGASVRWAVLETDIDGMYIKTHRRILLNQAVASKERRSFTFYHELMHHLIEHNDEIPLLFRLSPFANHPETMERMCDQGAAELLIPSDDMRHTLRERGFSISHLPELSKRYTASSIAVAFQMLKVASHKCFLVVAEPFKPEQINTTRLRIIYSGASSASKYNIKRFQVLSRNSLLNEAIGKTSPVIGREKIPFASGNGWTVDCEAMSFRDKVFAFFNVDKPISNTQLSLF